MTPEACAEIEAATDIVGYAPYLDALAAAAGQRGTRATIASSSTARGSRCALAVGGAQVAVVSGGDPGVFAMAAAVFEAIEGRTGLARDRRARCARHIGDAGGGGAARRAARP